MRTQPSEGAEHTSTRNLGTQRLAPCEERSNALPTLRSFFAWAIPALVLALFSGASLQADTIYNNSTNDLRVRFDPGTLEVGDEIILAGSGRFLTNFSFEYWGTAQTAESFAGAVQARIRFYQNDGAPFNEYATPGTQFFESQWFGIGPTPRNVLVFTAGEDLPPQGLWIPGTNFTWAVQFQGMAAGDVAGVDIYSPVVVGQGYPDYWENNAAGWQLKTNTVTPMNFAAVFQASEFPATPPPLQIGLLQNQAVLSWPLWAYQYSLETSPEVTGSPWTPLTEGVYRSGDSFVFTNTSPTGIGFYQLRR